MQFEFIHYLLIVLIWVAVFNICYMVLKREDKDYPKPKRKVNVEKDLPKVQHKTVKKNGKNSDPFYDELFVEDEEGGECYE